MDLSSLFWLFMLAADPWSGVPTCRIWYQYWVSIHMLTPDPGWGRFWILPDELSRMSRAGSAELR